MYRQPRMSDERELIEKLAEAEHAGWARWMKYVFSQCIANEDGSLTIPAELAAQWQRQIDTSYGDLSEPEKEADRREVRRILPLIRAWFRRGRADRRRS